jgi:hypothetical protein
MTKTTNMTISDYLAEFEIWPYSRERFDLLKECGELVLMEVYAEAEGYVVENAASTAHGNLGLLIAEAGGPLSAADKLAGRLSSSPRIAAKLAEKKYGVGTQVFDLLRTISRANIVFWGEAAVRFTEKRKDRIATLNAEARNLSERMAKSGTDKFDLSGETDTKHMGIELVRAAFDNDTVDLRVFNDALKDRLSDADHRTLKANERWLAPKLAIQQSKIVGSIGDLLTETGRIVGAVREMHVGSAKPLDIVKEADFLAAKIAGMKNDLTINFVIADTLKRTHRLSKDANDKLNDDINDFIRHAKPGNTAKKVDADSDEAAYGPVFTALASLITQLRQATKAAIEGGNAVMNRIDKAIEMQNRVLSRVREQIKK